MVGGDRFSGESDEKEEGEMDRKREREREREREVREGNVTLVEGCGWQLADNVMVVLWRVVGGSAWVAWFGWKMEGERKRNGEKWWRI